MALLLAMIVADGDSDDDDDSTVSLYLYWRYYSCTYNLKDRVNQMTMCLVI